MSKILIVDDSPSQQLAMKQLVERLGHTVITADDGEQAVAVCKAELPDLVLMDVVMPKLNGFQATRALSNDPTTKHIAVIIVTTKDQDTDRVWGLRQGAKAYLTKPFNENELIEIVNQFVSKAA